MPWTNDLLGNRKEEGCHTPEKSECYLLAIKFQHGHFEGHSDHTA